MSVSWPFSVYLCDRQAKQSERSLHSDTVPWCWNESKGKMARVCVGVCVCASRMEHFKTARSDFKNVCVCLCVCLSVAVRSLKREWVRTRVCVLSSLTVCVLFSVCTGVYLYKDVGGVLDLWVTVQTVRHTPFHPLIQVAVEGFP